MTYLVCFKTLKYNLKITIRRSKMGKVLTTVEAGGWVHGVC